MLPAAAAIGAIIDQKKAGGRAECGERPLGALERRTGSAGMEERRCAPRATGVENGLDGSRGISRAHGVWWKLISAAEQEEAASGLRHPEVGCVQDVFPEVVAKVA